MAPDLSEDTARVLVKYIRAVCEKHGLLQYVNEEFVETLCLFAYKNFQEGYVIGAMDVAMGKTVLTYDPDGKPLLKGGHELTEVN